LNKRSRGPNFDGPVFGGGIHPGAAVGPDLRSTHLARPHGCSIAPDGRLVIADSDNDRILAGVIQDGRRGQAGR